MNAVVAKWSNSASDRLQHCATVATGDSEALATKERLTDELSAFISAMNKYHICPAFNAQNQVSGNFQQLRDKPNGMLRDRIYTNAEFLSRLEAAKQSSHDPSCPCSV
jgi:HKD family nuclease